MGIDHFLDMGRTATNVLGNGIATGVVAKWENAIGTETEEEEEEEEALRAPSPVPVAAE
jgi:Na+/H+-dicarboxylate symporter